MTWSYEGTTVPPNAATSIAAAADYAGRAERALADTEDKAGEVDAKLALLTAAVESAESAAAAAGAALANANDILESVIGRARATEAAADAVAADATAAATDLALVQSAMASIAAVSVPALPWLIDGLPPSVLLLAGSGAMMLGGGYVDATDILTWSSAAKWVEGGDGTLHLSPANSPAYNWRTIDGIRVREILIEPAGATNHLPTSEGRPASSYYQSTEAPTANGLLGALTSYTLKKSMGPGSGAFRLIGTSIPASPGDIITHTIALMSGSVDQASVGLFFSMTGWAGATASAKVISGPGIAALMSGYNSFLVSGLTSTPTVVALTYVMGTEGGTPGAYVALSEDAPADATIRYGREQVERGAVATSYVPTTGSPATRIPDDVRLTTAALEQAATETGATVVISGSAYGANWVVGGAVGGAILVSSGSYRPGDYGELVTPIGWTPPFDDGFVVALACAPASRRASCDGGAVASSGISSAWSLATETSIRIGNATWGGSGSAQIHLRSLRIHPFIATDTGLQAALGV